MKLPSHHKRKKTKFGQKFQRLSALSQSLEKFIKKEKLFTKQDSLLVAVSGGVDSVVLVRLLLEIGFSPAIAHCNFQLRGTASDEDAEFVTQLAQSHQLPIHLQKFDTTAFAAEHHISTQVAARQLRYEWFQELMDQHKYKYLLTAHHANDQVETMLYNLSKGTGVAGLRGIPMRNEHIRRPLLLAKREEIEAYAKENELTWREDASNQEAKYSRNQIRLHVIPELKKINPGLEQTMSQNSKRFEALERLLENQASEVTSQHLSTYGDAITITLEWYDVSKGGLAVLTEMLKSYGYSFDQCLSIDEAIMSGAVGKQFYSKTHSLAIDRNQLNLIPTHSDESFEMEVGREDNSISTPFATYSIETSEESMGWSKDSNVAYLNADQIKYPIKLRNWRQGDHFYPLGMKGKKKVSDFMIDEKIPVNLKSRVSLFESEGNILWIAGYRIDDRYKITPNTKRVLIIKKTDHV